ncbi:ankyrin repeat domain-containing protein [Thermodesulfobacteriota bacterium]
MAFAFLWIETLALTLIFIAFFYRLSSPLKRRYLQVLIRIVVFLIPFFLGGAFTVLAWYLRKNNLDAGWMFGYSLSWLICMLVGFAFVRKYARKNQVTGEETCLSWRPMTMAGAFGIVLSLSVVTFLKMDADARARLDAAQARALALATMVTPEPVPWEQNAARLYEKASEEIKLPSWAREIHNAGFMPDLTESEKILAKNRKALLLTKRASGMPSASFVPNPGVDRAWPGFLAKYPEVAQLRDGVRLLALDCYVKASHGDTEGALESIDAMAATARHCGSDPYLISTMVASGIIGAQKSSLECLLALVPKVDAELIPLPVEKKSMIIGLWQRSLLMEEAKILYSISYDLATDRLDFGSTVDNFLFSVFPYRALMSRYDLAFFEMAWQKNNEFASRPIYEVYQEQKKWEKTMKEKPGGLLSAIAGFPQMSSFAIRPHIAEAQSGLMHLALAVTAYYANNGYYPNRPEDLTPDYIREIPIDPFDGKPLKIRASDKGLILYSIGPDFNDNRGETENKFPHGKDKSGDILFRIGAAYDRAFFAPALPKLAGTGNADLVRRALAVGADVNLDVPLVEAALKGHDGVVTLLLERGADINAVKETEQKAKRKKKPTVRSRSLTFSPKPVIGGMTALMGACMEVHLDTAELLLEKGADPNTANKKGRTPLMLLSGTGILKAMAWMEREFRLLDESKKEIQVLTAKIGELEGKGSDDAEKKLEIMKVRLDRAKRRVEHLQSDNVTSGKSGPMPGLESGTQGRAALVQLLLDAGADIHTKDVIKSTALHFAVYQGDNETAKVLIEKGAYINARNGFGWSPLIIAKAAGNRPMEALLKDAGASLDTKDQKTVNRLGSSLARLQMAQNVKPRVRRK